MKSAAPAKVEPALDHLILGIADLEYGIDWLEKKTGVRAVPGGTHPGAGTRNALASLGEGRYLEIMSLDPGQAQANWLAAWIGQLKKPQLLTWAAATPDIRSVSRVAEDSGLGFEGPVAGSRLTPAGARLEWKLLRIITGLGGTIPFFIEWEAGVVHPSVDSPSGCTIDGFEIRHPQEGRVREILSRLDIRAETVHGPEPGLIAYLRTPKGLVCLE